MITFQPCGAALALGFQLRYPNGSGKSGQALWGG